MGGLLNSSQRQQEAYLSDAFGLPVSSNGTVTFAQGQIDGFAATSGYQTDNDTGLIRCGNRYYNPFLGRFITQDHAKSGTNWYEYCGNDPTGRTDPSGNVPQTLNGGNANLNSPQVGDFSMMLDLAAAMDDYNKHCDQVNSDSGNGGIATLHDWSNVMPGHVKNMSKYSDMIVFDVEKKGDRTVYLVWLPPDYASQGGLDIDWVALRYGGGNDERWGHIAGGTTAYIGTGTPTQPIFVVYSSLQPSYTGEYPPMGVTPLTLTPQSAESKGYIYNMHCLV